ncbi:MAG: ATP-binding cassette domain-containing protein [Clostridia bacterium]|nr:ATP-binding cassette domain-containing protein [Clostridia bacterium]
MLQLKSVTKKYKTKAGEVYALNGVSLTFPSTGMVFITGKSGCGKTTLLNIIGGLDSVDSGEIFVQDKSLSAFSAKEYDSYRNTFVGFIFQEYNLLAEYTVEYNVKIAMELQGRKADDKELDRLLKEMEIEGLRARKPSELSGGQRQRVAIARALVKEPRIIMADEPTGALDSATGIQVFDALKKLSKDKLVIVVSHDNEFAEKYADRIIRLVDGKVVEDITFTSRELTANISEQENMLVVKEGAELSETDKDILAKAVKTRKKIEVTEKLYFRDKKETGEVTWEQLPSIALKKSKMKLRSSAYLGVKSLVVKPVRLIITILISALAFAVFGLFDTIANFNTQKILKNSLLKSNSTIVANTSYIIDESVGDRYEVKTSQATVDRLAQETGGAVKGIFDFRYNTRGEVLQSQSIKELTLSKMVIGKSYYSNSVNGYLEFDGEKEIDKQNNFRDFNYRLVLGRYPKLVYQEGELIEESLYEVAISTYLADSILFFLNGEKLNEEEVSSYSDLLDKQITVEEDQYKIVGLIDCGEIPKKYDEIKQSTPFNMQLNGLLDDYKAYMDSSARKCLFVGYGFKEAYKTLKEKASVFYAGDNDLKLVVPNDSRGKAVVDYVYDSRAYDEENILLFSGSYPQNTKLTLKDDEIVIHYGNLRDMLSVEINKISDMQQKRDIYSLLNNLSGGTKEENRQTLKEIFIQLPNLSNSFTSTIKQYSKQTGKTIEKEVKIVGVYFGVDEARYVDSSTYRLMMNGNLMQSLNICNEQGDYNKILFSQKSVRKGTDTIVKYLVAEKGLSLTWYNNSILNIIEENQTLIGQAADLFLYATIALAVFAVFMLYNYISTSIANKRRSVGVLRGLGACGKDIFFAFLTESLIIALINGALASVLSAVGCMLVNLYIRDVMHFFVSFALFGVRQVLLIMGVSLLLSVLSSALPIIKISKKKPVELIRQP